MSHLSKIQTTISNLDILKQTLNDLEINWNINNRTVKDYDQNTQKLDVVINPNNIETYSFMWNGHAYEFIADFQLWRERVHPTVFLDKILQKYAYNSVIVKSSAHGYNCTKEQVGLDGSVKIVLEKWVN